MQAFLLIAEAPSNYFTPDLHNSKTLLITSQKSNTILSEIALLSNVVQGIWAKLENVFLYFLLPLSLFLATNSLKTVTPANTEESNQFLYLE